MRACRIVYPSARLIIQWTWSHRASSGGVHHAPGGPSWYTHFLPARLERDAGKGATLDCAHARRRIPSLAPCLSRTRKVAPRWARTNSGDRDIFIERSNCDCVGPRVRSPRATMSIAIVLDCSPEHESRRPYALQGVWCVCCAPERIKITASNLLHGWHVQSPHAG